jgi:hypothetical protein
MATWFATANGNINSAGRWAPNPNGSGTALTWPPASGDILVANGKVIDVNVSTNLGSGQFRTDAFGGATLDAGFFRASTAGVTMTGDFVGVGAYGYIVRNTSSGTVSLVGNVTGGALAGYVGVFADTAGSTTNITGIVTGGSATNTWGVNVSNAAATVNITGSCIGGSGATAHGAMNGAGGTLTLTGTATGGSGSGSGVRNQSTGTAIVTNAVASATASGIFNNAGGTFTVSGYAQASTAQSGAANSAQGILEVGETRSASNGLGAVTGAFRFASATAAKTMPYTPDGQISMTVLDVAAIVPAESDVRKGLVYGDGAYTGTLPLGRNRTSMAGRF